jgi:hypothetical protein
MTRERLQELKERHASLGGDDPSLTWVFDIIDQHSHKLPPLDANQEMALETIVFEVLSRSRNLQLVADQMTATILELLERQSVSKAGVAARKAAAKERKRRIIEAYETAAREGRVATNDELMAAGGCEIDTVYRALKDVSGAKR